MYKIRKTLLLSIFFLPVFHCYADEDTQLRLQQSIDHRIINNQYLVEDNSYFESSRLPDIVISGQAVNVERNARDVGTALYLSVMHRQWDAAFLYLDVYREIDDHEPSLVFFSEGLIYRAQGLLSLAELSLYKANELQPENQITRLELARVLFENYKISDSEFLFKDIFRYLESYNEDRVYVSIRETVDRYLQAIDQRKSMQGYFSFGAVYDDNINRGSERDICNFYIPDTDVCLYRSQGERAIAGYGIEYEGTISKYIPLKGHHGIQFRSLGYGKYYDSEPYYNELTLNLSAGYAYRSAVDHLTLSAIYELSFLDNRNEYLGGGLRSEWLHIFSPSLVLRIEGDYKQLRHSRHREADAELVTAYMTLFKSFSSGLNLFGGLDVVGRISEERYMNSYLQTGFRLGGNVNLFGNIEATTFVSWRDRKYDRYNPIFSERRHDDELSYTLVVKAPGLNIDGFIPSLVFKHNRLRSNVDWLYSHDRNQVSLKLERRF